jgi:nucleoside-diphosphate-sugar epimerase
MKIFVTGASGYIGNKLALALAAQGDRVHALVRNQQDAELLRNPMISVFFGDLGDRKSIRQAIAGCEQTYHVAGLAKLWAKNPNEFYEVNVNGTKNVLIEAFENGIKKLVYTSSCAVFGPSLNKPLCEKDPRTIGFGNDYDLSKYIAECLVSEYAHKGLFAVIVNPSRVYGPGIDTYSNTLTRLIARCLRGTLVFFPGCKEIVSNYTFIDDVVAGHISAMNRGISGERYILGGENLSYREVCSVVREKIIHARLLQIPLLAIKGIAWMELAKNKLTGLEPAFTPSFIDRYIKNGAFSCQKAIQQLDYKITPFREGISQTITHLKNKSYAQAIIYPYHGGQ